MGRSYLVYTLARRLAWVFLAAPYFMRANIIIAEWESVWALVVCHGSNIHGNLRYGVHNVDGTTHRLPIEDLPGGPQRQHCDGEDGGLKETHDSVDFNWGRWL